MKSLLTIHLNCFHQTLRWSDPNPLKMYTSKTYMHFNNNTLRADDNRTELGARDGVTANCQLRAEGERLDNNAVSAESGLRRRLRGGGEEVNS